MKPIDDIAIHSEPLPPSESSMVEAVIIEIQQQLSQYLSNGQGGIIDIHSLPLSDTDYQQLNDLLGKGEVHAVAQLAGETEIYETGYAGVWWLIHKNTDQQIIAEHIEVNHIPLILCSHRDDIKAARDRLGSIGQQNC